MCVCVCVCVCANQYSYMCVQIFIKPLHLTEFNRFEFRVFLLQVQSSYQA